MRPIILSSLIMKSLLFFFFRKGNVYSRESRQPWTGLWLWLVSESWYGNLGNLNTCVSFQEEHFREGCKFIGQNISHFQKTSLCTSVVWTEKGKWSMEKEFGSYQVPELSSVPLQKKEGKGAWPWLFQGIDLILAIRYHLLWWGFSSRGKALLCPCRQTGALL